MTQHETEPRREQPSSSSELPFDAAHVLAPVQATGLDGEPVRLGTLWEHHHVVLVFLRHFG
jgi:hypothetical protein